MTCYENDIKVIASVGDEDLKVDIMNISLPCQAYSEAHITIGKNDNANFEASMSLGPVLDKGKPRVVVFENVHGLWKRRADTNWPNVPECWDKILQQFTSRGYSVRWEIFNFAEYGLPQVRKRLIFSTSWQGHI